MSYSLAGRGDATGFTREFTYPLPNPLYALLDALIPRRRIRAESAEAMRQLKQRLEASAGG